MEVANEVATVMGLTKVAALAYLMFNLFTPPCFAALGAMNSEMQDKKWLWGGIALQLCTGYTVAFFVYQIGTLDDNRNTWNRICSGLDCSGCICSNINCTGAKKGKSIQCRVPFARIEKYSESLHLNKECGLSVHKSQEKRWRLWAVVGKINLGILPEQK